MSHIIITNPSPIVVQVKGGKTTTISSPTGSATRLQELTDVTSTPLANGDVLTYISANAKFEFHPAPAGGSSSNSFGTVNISGQNDVIANTSSDTLQLIAGTGILLTTDNVNSSVTIVATGGSATDQFARDHANGAFDEANTANTTAQSAFNKANGAVQTGFVTINVASQSDVVATGNSNTLILVAGTGMAITTDAPNDTITFVATGGSSADQFARDQANAAFNQANTANTTGQSAFDKANGAIYTAAQIRANISNTAPINYNATTGVISLPATANGQVLIGNSISGTFDVTTLIAGTGVTLANGAGSLTISAADAAAAAQANAAFNRANAAYANGNTAIYTAAQIRANISNTAPISYDVSNGIISHANSGVTSGVYGNSSIVPSFVVDSTGHVTSVTNSTIAIDASQITSNILTVNRGGTGQNTYSNGDLLIGNGLTGGLSRANLTQGYGVLITNGPGTIRIETAFGKTYYFNITNTADVAGYHTAPTNPSPNPENTTVTLCTTALAFNLVGAFITDPGEPGTTLLPSGSYARHIYATTDGASSIARLRVELYKRAANGQETLLRTNDSPDFSSADTDVILLWTLTDSNGYTIDPTDRIVFKIYAARISGGSGSVNVTIFYEGTTHASSTTTSILTPTGDTVARTHANAAYDKANGAVQTGFPTINVASQNNVVATTNNDTLVLVAGQNMSIVTDNVNNKITFASANDAVTSVAGRVGAVVLNTNDVTENVAGPYYFTAAKVRANISNTAPINYDATTGIISHALSGATPSGYGDAGNVPKVIVDDKGHVTSITNTAIAISASQVSSGTLVVTRGGTGQTAITVNGSLLIGNTVSGGFDVNPITQGAGTLVTNDKGSITIASNVISVAGRTGDVVLNTNDVTENSAGPYYFTAPKVRSNISNTAPINYDSTAGVISHADSGAVATGYGNSATIPVLVVTAKGHLSSITNTSIAIDASQITSGILAVGRGGTGQTAPTVNGAILIGNTVSGGYDINNITQGTGITITNDKGSITIAADAGTVPALVLLGANTANISPTLSFTSLISSTYDQYKLMWEDVIMATTTSLLLVQVSVDNGANWKTTGYINNTVYLLSGSPGYVATTTGIDLKGPAYAVSDAMYGDIIIANVNASGRKVHAYGSSVYDNAGTPVFSLVNGRYDTVGTINAIRLLTSSGNLTSGVARLYGIKN